MTRESHIDLLKVVASQLIVWHHFSTYEPLSDVLLAAAPDLSRWLYDYGRMAVQIFLVVGGYLAIKRLAPNGTAQIHAPLRQLLQRYLRLTVPFAVAMLLALACNQAVRHWQLPDLSTTEPSVAQYLAHVALLQGITDTEALASGVWYVAIDFQLYLLLLCLLWAGKGLAFLLITLTTLASLYCFNQYSELDDWALYFFGSYGLGIAAYGAGRSHHPLRLLCGMTVLVLGALAIDFRERMVLAWLVALGLGWIGWRNSVRTVTDAGPNGWQRGVAFLARSSYALFLVHYPILLLGSDVYLHLGLQGNPDAMPLLAACWLASMVVAVLLERWIERPLGKWLSRDFLPVQPKIPEKMSYNLGLETRE